MRKVYTSAFITLILSFFYIFLVFHHWSLLHWVNVLFYIGLVYLLVGSIIFVWASDFFSAFFHSFKHFLRVISKREQVIQEIEGRATGFYPAKKTFIPSKPWIYIGLCYCIVSILFSLKMVYFGR
ncbi:DUF3899 domain-containing protein [Bacillus sp. FJAT-49736]|nr:DUF3899 domain-containing protein [Bacillus sp. FJAT-49736]